MEFNLADVQTAVAAAYPDREAIVWPAGRRTHAELDERSRRMAKVLIGAGLGVRTEREELRPHQSGQDHLAVYLHDSPEYLEAMLGSYKARLAPFNVNYRYVSGELRDLLSNGHPRAIVYHGEFTPLLASTLPSLTGVKILLRVDDGSPFPLLPGAVDYEEAIATVSGERPPTDLSPDDLYIVYTGGTTGLPKGVLWRQADIFVAAMGGWDARCGRREWESIDEIVTAAAAGGARILTAAPLMHGAGQWPAFQALLSGGTVFLPGVTGRREARYLLEVIERERVGTVVIVGDAFARPLLDELRRRDYDCPSLRMFVNGGAALSAGVRAGLLDALPDVTILDTMGSSESGAQARGRTRAGAGCDAGRFRPFPGTCVVSEDRSTVLPPGHDEVGWLATEGRIPLGYLNDAAKTALTFPTVEGRRMVVPGDRARHMANGEIEVLGRDAVTINSGGEKIFAEEVESAILSDPRIADVIVVGRPSDRWGNEVVAVVSAGAGMSLSEEDVIAAARPRLAGYKVPKAVVFVDRIERSPAGKPDYRWASEVAAGS